MDHTRRLVGQARRIGFSRRELLKMALVAAVPVAVAACSGNDPAKAALDKFAVGTWRVRYQRPSGGGTSRTPEPPVDATMTINSDGTYTSTGAGALPSSGTWMMGNAFIQVNGRMDSGYDDGRYYEKQGMASSVPDTLVDSATIDWQWDTGSRTVPATWDSGTKTLTLVASTHEGIQFPVAVAK